MIESFVFQLIFKLAVAVVGILGARFTLKWYDKYYMSDEFKRWLTNADSISLATYYGMRFIGTGILVGLTLS